MSKIQAQTKSDLLGDIAAKPAKKIHNSVRTVPALPGIGAIVTFHMIVDNEKTERPAIVIRKHEATGTLDLNVFMEGHLVFQRKVVHGTDNCCWSFN